MIQKQAWENLYNRNVFTEWYPSEPIVRLLCSYRKKYGSKGIQVLDLGCGNGRHVWLASREGFFVYGIDLSESAIKIAKKWLKKEGLLYKDLRSGNIVSGLPYKDGFFDIVISYGVLDHMVLNDARKVMVEVNRILKPGGIFFAKLEANTSFTFNLKKQIAKNENLLDKKSEKGIIQHFFSQKEIEELFRNFHPMQSFRDDYRRFEDLNKNFQSRWIFIGKKKA